MPGAGAINWHAPQNMHYMDRTAETPNNCRAHDARRYNHARVVVINAPQQHRAQRRRHMVDPEITYNNVGFV